MWSSITFMFEVFFLFNFEGLNHCEKNHNESSQWFLKSLWLFTVIYFTMITFQKIFLKSKKPSNLSYYVVDTTASRNKWMHLGEQLLSWASCWLVGLCSCSFRTEWMLQCFSLFFTSFFILLYKKTFSHSYKVECEGSASKNQNGPTNICLCWGPGVLLKNRWR